MTVDAPPHVRGIHNPLGKSHLSYVAVASRALDIGSQVGGVMEVNPGRGRHHIDLAPEDGLARVIQLHQFHDLGVIRDSALMAAHTENNRWKAGLRSSGSAGMAARAGHLALDDVSVVRVCDGLWWSWGRLFGAPGQHYAHQCRPPAGGGDADQPGTTLGALRTVYSALVMAITRDDLMDRYSSRTGRIWSRVESERPTSYWEQNRVGGRRLARRLIDRWLDPAAEQYVLDAGCGLGRVAEHLAGRGARVVGLDLLPRFNRRHSVPRLSFVEGDIKSCCCPSGTFTVALLQEVLEDYSPPERLSVFKGLTEWGMKRIILVTRTTSPWGRWAERLAAPEEAEAVDTVELYREIHLSTSYFLTRREKVRRRNYEVEIAEFTLSLHGAEV